MYNWTPQFCCVYFYLVVCVCVIFLDVVFFLCVGFGVYFAVLGFCFFVEKELKVGCLVV